MPSIRVDDVELHYESHGVGTPLLLLHELAMDASGWVPQISELARRHRVVTLNLRGYPPSSVPADPAAYRHETLIADIEKVLDGLELASAFVIGHGTGGNLALGFALAHRERVRGLALIGSGAGFGNPGWKARSSAMSKAVSEGGMAVLVESVGKAAQRLPFAAKDPRGWAALLDGIRRLSPLGIANLMASGVRDRPTFTELADDIAGLTVPLLLLVGDRDAPAFDANVFLARTAPHAGLAVLPCSGHTLPAEEPALVNRLLADFIAQVREGRWAGWRRAAGDGEGG